MRWSVIGRNRELTRVTMADVAKFVKRYLVPANGILTIVGRFDPAAVKAQIEQTLAMLPPGERAAPPKETKLEGRPGIYRMRERRSRQPRVSVMWRLEGLGQRTQDALLLGGFLLSNYVDGAFGTQVRAG